MDTKLDNQHLVLVHIDAPNDTSQKIKFFQELNKTLTNYADNNLIIGGDFNCSLTPKDRKASRKPITNIWSSKKSEISAHTSTLLTFGAN